MNHGAKSSFKSYAQFFKEKSDDIKLHKKLSKIFKTSLKGYKIDIPKLDRDVDREHIKAGLLLK